jgi:hypothetical protein
MPLLDVGTVRCLVVILFFAITSPISAHLISRAAHSSGVRLCEKSVVDEMKRDILSSPVTFDLSMVKESRKSLFRALCVLDHNQIFDIR